MNSHIYLTLFLFINCNSLLFSQYTGKQNDDYVLETVQRLDNTIRLNETNGIVDLSTVKGSPYENDAFELGKAIDKASNDSRPYYLRYNIYNDVIEIKQANKSYELKKASTIYAVINNIEYHFQVFSDNSETKEGYLKLLYSGTNINIYSRKTKKFKEAIKAKTSYHQNYPATFIDSQSFYMQKGKMLKPLSRKKKEITDLFPQKENELKNYIKKEKLSLNSEEDLIKLFTYIESILK